MNQTNAHLPRREKGAPYQMYETGSRPGSSRVPLGSSRPSPWNRESVEETQPGKVVDKALRAELDDTKEKLRKSEAEVRRLSDYVREQNINLSKLQETVKIQSHQIQKNPEPSKNAQRRIEGIPTPQNRQYPDQSQRYAPISMQPGQGYRATAQHSQQSFQAQAKLGQQSFKAPSPFATNVSNQATIRPTSTIPGATSVIHVSTNAGQVIQTDNTGEFEFTGKASRMFKLIEDWGYKYCRFLPTSGSIELTQTLINGMTQTCSVQSLLSDVLKAENTRYFIAAGYINSAMTLRIFNLKVIRGFNATQEDVIKDTRAKMVAGQPQVVRAAYQQVIADAVTRIRSSPGFQEWLFYQARRFTEGMIHDLQPLIVASEIQNANEDLLFILHDAFKIGIDMHTINRTYYFDYCQTGTETWFNPGMMVNRDPDIRGDPVSLKNQNYHVRLCINPVVTMTNLVGPSIVPKTMHLAEVLLFK